MKQQSLGLGQSNKRTRQREPYTQTSPERSAFFNSG